MLRQLLVALVTWGFVVLVGLAMPAQESRGQQQKAPSASKQTTLKQATTKQVPPTAPAKAAAPVESTPTASASDQQKKNALMQSERWQQAVREFHDWLSVQTLYDEQQVAEMRRDLAARIDQMSAAELEQALAQMEARLTVLLSDEAQDARAWVAQYLSVLAAGPRAQFKAGLPDVRNMTAAQMKQELTQIQNRRASRQQGQAALQQARTQRIENVRNQRATPAPTGQSRGDSSAAARFNPVQSDFSPRQYEPGFMRRNNFYVNPWGGVSIGLNW